MVVLFVLCLGVQKQTICTPIKVLSPPTMAPTTQVAGCFPYQRKPLVRTTADVVSGNNISRTTHAPPTPVKCEEHVAKTDVQTAYPHTDCRRGAQPVQLSYFFQKVSTITVIQKKTLQTYGGIHSKTHNK